MRLSRLIPFAALVALAGLVAGLVSPPAEAIPPIPKAGANAARPHHKHPRGRKAPAADVLAARHAAAFKRHDHRNRHLPRAVQADYDLRKLGKALPAGDQGQCGDCYLYSTCRVASTAYVRASNGALKFDNSFRFAAQYGLDCQPQLGGCGGGDEAEVAELLKARGFPIEADYGPYYASPRRCGGSPAKVYKILDYVYCTPSQEQGVASVADIKAAVLQYGEVSTAVAADDSWDGYRGGVLSYNPLSPRDVNHAVSIIGWHDDASLRGGGYFVVQNNWGNDYGDGTGCINVQYGSHQLGTEAFSIAVTEIPPQPPAPPAPPAPPTPPGPPAPPAPQTVTINVPQQPVYSGIIPIGHVPAFTVTATVDGAKAAGEKAAGEKGVSIDILLAVLKLARDIQASGNGQLIADFRAVESAIFARAGVLPALEQLATDLVAVGTDPAILADLLRIATDLGVQVPQNSVLRGKPCCGK